MEPNLEQDRRQAHELLDALPPEQLSAVRNLLEATVEPLARSLTLAETEEESVSQDTLAALDCSRASLERGDRISHDEILREFGLKQ